MFGSDDHKSAPSPSDDKTMAQVADAVQALNGSGTPTPPETSFAPDPVAAAAATAPDQPDGKPSVSAVSSVVSAPTAKTDPPANDTPVSTQPPAATESTLAAPLKTDAVAPEADDLLDIKQNALEQLKPLVDHLDPVPEEKFDALMMMIRASDDQALIQPAYDTAQKITDDKKRAEALLDVVNEINYLTSTQQ